MVNFRDNIVFIIAKAHQHAQGMLKARLKAFGLTPVQCLVLESLWSEEGLSVGEVGRRLILDTATLAGVLDRMVTSGWLRREVDATDARIARIYLSEKAKTITEDLEKAIDLTNNELLSNFSLEEKLLFKRFLRDIYIKT
jgi:DNA-binding MarR family transcriptional regulator